MGGGRGEGGGELVLYVKSGLTESQKHSHVLVHVLYCFAPSMVATSTIFNNVLYGRVEVA